LGGAGDRAGDHASRDACKEALRAAAERVVSTRKPVFIPSIARSDLESQQKSDLLQLGFTSIAAQPVKHQRDVLGVLVVLTGDPTNFDIALRSFFETVAH